MGKYHPPTPDPTPRQIRAACLRIQRTWDAATEQSRRLSSVTLPGLSIVRPMVETPVVKTVDLHADG